MRLLTGAHPMTGFPVLEALPWHENPAVAYSRAGALLAAEQDLTRRLAEWLSTVDSNGLEYLLDRSTERNTHIKWCLGGKRSTYLVWLHQYKPPDVYAKAIHFAASVHDHRYGFVSKVLNGALDAEWFARQDGSPTPISMVRRTIAEGDIVTMTPDEIHCIRSVLPNTCTLVIQGPAIRRHSTVFHLGAGSTESMGDLEAKFPELLARFSGSW